MNSTTAYTRHIYPFNRGWLFGGPTTEGATQPTFDDSGFTPITIPHTNKLLPWHSFDDRDYQFVSIYRRHFKVPAEARGLRVFLDFGGAMTAATVTINGHNLGEHRGGYVPFSHELTSYLDWEGDNVVAVEVDSTERPDIPPFGGQIDYLTFGGIYRDVQLRAVAPTFIENVFARTSDVLSGQAGLEVQAFIEHSGDSSESQIEVSLRHGNVSIRSAQAILAPGDSSAVVKFEQLEGIKLWDLGDPHLYTVEVQLIQDGQPIDSYTTRIGFRHAEFTERGFKLNGKYIKLRGLNRHQTFPFVGQAMPGRVQRRDALILKNELKCNIVRTSHYPQSPHFLDCCDEIGLLVFEEIPGWQHLGDQDWKDVACADVEAMVRRDWNHPSIILWGVRINESPDDHDFYARTNEIAHRLDPTRQTGGVRCFPGSELLEDVYTINDFNPNGLNPPEHARQFNTEFVGHMFPTKQIDNVERVQEHVRRHAFIHNWIGGDAHYAGGLGWCAFDYNTHRDFGSGDRICYHGVSDIFRLPKPAAGFYKSQCDPAEEIVLEPAFHWAIGDRSEGGGPGRAMVCSNCDELRFYIKDELVATEHPDRENFGNLPYPPFFTDALSSVWGSRWHNLRIDGYLKGEKVISKEMSADGVDRQFLLHADDAELVADGSDATRVVFRVTDEFGAARPFATGAIQLTLDGDGTIIGENPFCLIGGVGAVWIKAGETPGRLTLTARHPVLGERSVGIEVRE